MEKYNPSKIEKKWQKYWSENPELSQAPETSDNPKKYVLDMFPYPSGAGLHAGHVESYTATDIYSRYLRLKGFNVIHPQGWDAFGLPAENYAIKTKVHPSETTKQAIATFKRQMDSLGFSYDWSREVNSSDPEYYKWTQWFFLLLYKNGLAYKAKSNVNWCESCQTVLANEQAEGGICERCKNEVIQKDLEQWFFKITDFIESKDSEAGLIEGLDKIDWPESTKAAQKNWIGKSEGAQFKMRVIPASEPESQDKILNQVQDDKFLEVYTTRVDTVFGMTYVVVAPEHSLINEVRSQISNIKEVDKYILESKSKTDLERMELKDKSGVELKGVKAVNPFNNRAVPVFVADYVLGHYGTGAVMAVPAHDERDFEFAQKYGLPIKQSVCPDPDGFNVTAKILNLHKEIFEAAEGCGLKYWLIGGLACAFQSGVIYREHNDLDIVTKDDESLDKLCSLLNELGFKKTGEKEVSENVNHILFQKDGIEIDLGPNRGEFGTDADFDEEVRMLNGFQARVVNTRLLKVLKEYQMKTRSKQKDQLDWGYLNGKVFTDDGVVVNSKEYDGLTSSEARQKMTEWLEEKGLGSRKVNYRMRDWLVSRQRYWGAPIPIIYCDKCGEVPVSEKDLPVILPMVQDFAPKGKSPLAASAEFMNVKCPQCGGEAKRESDTMDTFVCSSWYYFRYSDPKNDQEFASKSQIEKWLPVDLYLGGAEHTVLHLLYSRFFTKALKRLGYISFDEPFLKLRHQGIILGEDGRKMSKSFGNVVNPDDYVKEFGADALRMYEMFMGPLEDMKPWSQQGIIGVLRFLEKVWRLKEKVSGDATKDNKLDSLLHKTIKKVGEDIESFKFNTAVSALMILVNEMDKSEKLEVKNYELLAKILSPFAPHLGEELWSGLGHKDSIFKEAWPEYNPQLIQDEAINLVIQFNGKTRGTLLVAADIDEVGAKAAVEADEKLKNYLSGKEFKKVVFVKGRLINFVTN